MFTYPYDPTGKKQSNRFTEECVISSDVNENRVVVLKHRPFFAEGFEVRVSGASVPLTLGSDYELAHAIPELDSAVEGHLFCSVQFINTQIGGTVVFSGNLLGGNQYDPITDILDYLVKQLNNPTDASYYDVNGRPSLFPPTPGATGWSDMLNKSYIASAVNDIILDGKAANTAIQTAIDELKRELTALLAEMDQFNYPAHIAATHPHGTTAAQANAHPIDLKVPDTFMAFGKKLKQLVADIRALGLRESDLEAYLHSWVSKSVAGAFVYNITSDAPQIALQSNGAETSVKFANTGMTLESNGSVILAVGIGSNSKYVEWFTDAGSVKITSTDNRLEMGSITLNGKQLLTTSSLMEYQNQGTGGAPSDPDDNKLYITGENGLAFTGKGSRADPVKGTITLPLATSSSPGIAVVKSAKGVETEGAVAAPSTLTPYMGELTKYVPISYSVNSKPMDKGSIVLTKSDIGLGAVDNTADVDKPLSADQSAELNTLSEVHHTHPWSELGIPIASHNSLGTTKLGTTLNGLVANKAVAPAVLKDQDAIAERLLAKSAGARVGAATEFTAVKASSWVVNSLSVIAVRDLEYFAYYKGEKISGKVSGSVNIETTPMYNWFSPNNHIESTWATTVVDERNLETFDALTEKPTVAIRAKQIRVASGEMGSTSGVTILSKTRVHITGSRAYVYVAGGGNVTVYVNGSQFRTGESPLMANIPVTEANRDLCIAIKVECRDPLRAAGMRYEIRDNNYPVYRSSAKTPIVRLGEFVTSADDINHHIYLNMNSKSFFTRTEPIQNSEIDPTAVFIGTVHGKTLSENYMNNTPILFPEIRNFGTSSEVAAHAETPYLHKPKITDWRFSDNPNFKMLGILRTVPRMVVSTEPLPTQSGSSWKDYVLGTSESFAFHAGMDYHTLTLWNGEDRGPWGYVTPSNPKASGHPTYEGGIVVDYGYMVGSTPLNYHPELLFVSAFDDGCDYVTFNGDLNLSMGYFPTNPGSSGFKLTSRVDYPITIAPTKTTTYTSTAAKLLDFNILRPEEKVYLGRNPRYHFRYRYDYDTRMLYVLRIWSNPNVDQITIKELEFQVPFEMDRYFTGWVGVCNKEVPRKLRTRTMPSLLEINDARVDVNKYTYFRSLFESYVHARLGEDATDRDYKAFSIKMRSLDYDALDEGELDNGLTERIFLPMGGGVPTTRWDSQLPYCYHGKHVPIGYLCEDGGTDHWAGWTFPEYIVRPVVLRVAISPDQLSNSDPATLIPVKIKYRIKTNLPYAVIFGGIVSGENVIKKPATDTYVDVELPLPTQEQVQEVHFAFFNTTGRDIHVGMNGSFCDAAGKSFSSFNITNESGLYGVTDSVVVEKRNVFHMTTKVWEYICRQMKAEREAEGLTGM